MRNPLPQWISIYLSNIPAKFHPDPIWNGGDFIGVFEERRPNKKNDKNKVRDMGSFPDLTSRPTNVLLTVDAA